LLGTLAVAGMALSACREAAAPVSSYLAILPTIVASTSGAAGVRYRYHVRELSGTLQIDTVVSVAPADTVILPLPPATYVVDVDGVPGQCKIREGTEQLVLITEGSNTTALRLFVFCKPLFVVTVLADGVGSNLELVYHLAAADGSQRVGLIRSNDTLDLEGVPPGPAFFDLASIPAACIVASNGGAHRPLVIDSSGGAGLDFRISCSDPVRRPQVLDTRATYRAGVVGLVVRGTDPDRDIQQYVWDVTDCRRASLLGGDGPSLRAGLTGGRTANQDTVVVLTTFETGLADSVLARACLALWFGDTQGNSSAVVETPLVPVAVPPATSLFNAHFVGTDLLRTDLLVDDPTGEFLGIFVAVRLRDGTLGPPDGAPDVAYFNTSGYLGSAVPDVPLGNGRLTYDSFYGVIVYLLDVRGNFLRLEDDDLFQ